VFQLPIVESLLTHWFWLRIVPFILSRLVWAVDRGCLFLLSTWSHLLYIQGVRVCPVLYRTIRKILITSTALVMVILIFYRYPRLIYILSKTYRKVLIAPYPNELTFISTYHKSKKKKLRVAKGVCTLKTHQNSRVATGVCTLKTPPHLHGPEC
jgi:hypothetical protein